MMIDKKKSGFSLIEVMIVVAIISILGAIAYPSYVDYIRKGRRTDGMNALTAAMQKQEVYKANNAVYGTLVQANIPATSTEGYYTIAIDPAGCAAPCLSMTATPTALGDQNADHVSKYELLSTGLKRWTYDGTSYDSWEDHY